MVPAENNAAVLNSLISDVIDRSNHLSTGVLGTKAIMEALWMNGRSDVAFNLATQTTFPSWGNMVAQGCTTLREHWQQFEASDNPALGIEWQSQNHCMFGGGPGSWFYKGLAGISPLTAGYAQIQIKPEIVGSLTSASGSVNSVRGLVSTSWNKTGSNAYTLTMTIPVNSTATMYLPKIFMTNITVKEGTTSIWSNGSRVDSVSGVTFNSEQENYIVFNVGSGQYSFNVTGTIPDAPTDQMTYKDGYLEAIKNVFKK
jgi:alpha-L-rhamnosidase